MNIVFRTDASVQIGTGHVMRCLTLADALREAGANCTFICRTHKGHLLDLIDQRGHKAVPLAERESVTTEMQDKSLSHASWLVTDWATDAADTRQAIGETSVDWLIIDHYALDEQWEKAMRRHCKHLMVLDDLADRRHDCDLLLDQNLGRKIEDYSTLTPKSTTVLCGPRFALLRPEFTALRSKSLARRMRPKLKRLLVTMGGVDQNNATERVLRALCGSNLSPDTQITVVMGPHAPWRSEVSTFAVAMPWRTNVLIGIDNMAELMTQADLAIGASGSTNWERCCLGIPTLLVVLAENQKSSANALKSSGIVHVLDLELIQTSLPDTIAYLTTGNAMKIMSDKAATLTNGQGVSILIDHLLNTPVSN